MKIEKRIHVDFDHSKDSRYEALGITGKRAREIAEYVYDILEENDDWARAIENIIKKFDNNELILAICIVGFFEGNAIHTIDMIERRKYK
ncbi:hypothetical protein J7J18_04380 [bacterium]|nr:hypothetical protein [bacterium]